MELESPPVVDAPIFFLDYDGTLAPIVEHPQKALPHPGIPPVLEALNRLHPLWIVTGRNLGSLSGLLSIALRAIGVHGLELGTVGGPAEPRIDPVASRSLQSLKASVPEREGLWVEEKGPTFAIHFRQAADEDAARASLLAWAHSLPQEIEGIWGKKVLELRPRGYSKGHAVLEVLADFPERTPVYLGDDTTDEDAFRMLAEPAVTVKVGPGDTAARFRLPDVEAVADYLRAYV